MAVEAGELTENLRAMIEAERPDVVFTSTASTRVVVARIEQSLRVEVWSEGREKVSRAIAIEEDREKPALRVAALIAAEAIPRPRIVEAPPQPPRVAPVIDRPVSEGPVSIGTAPDEPAFMLFSLAMQGELWSLPVALHPGLSGSMLFRLNEEAFVGLRLHMNGFGCCVLSAAELDDTHVRLFGFAIAGKYELGAGFSLLASAGTTFVFFEGRGKYENAVDQSASGVEGALRGAAGYETPPLAGGFRLNVVLGVHARLERLTFNLVGPPGDEVDVDPGILAPFLELGVTLPAF